MRSVEKLRAWARARCAETFARRCAESHGLFRRFRQSLRLVGRNQPARAHLRFDLRRRANRIDRIGRLPRSVLLNQSHGRAQGLSLDAQPASPP